jgi:hypothetical protein
LKGRLADTDCRWGIISESVDCRTLAERGREDSNAPYPDYNANGVRRIYKSRYDCISTYIYQGATSAGSKQPSGLADRVLNMYNDIPVAVDEESYKQLREAGVDPALSQHVAHLFIRDPLVVFDGAVQEVDDETQTEHFESIQSTNWYVFWSFVCVNASTRDRHATSLWLSGKRSAGSRLRRVTAPTIPTSVGAQSFAAWKSNSLTSRMRRSPRLFCC